MKPLIVIGNGTSIKNIDFKQFDKKYDTFGINGSFKKWMDTGWFPTYHYIGRKHEQWKGHIEKFVNECERRPKTIFVNSTEYSPDEFINTKNVKMVNFSSWSEFSPDNRKWSNTFAGDLEIAVNFLYSKYSTEKVNEIIENFSGDIPYDLNPNGIIKYLTGKKDEIFDFEDKIPPTRPRFIKEFKIPDSLDNFQYEHGHSGLVACLIGIILGYKKIYLVGMDNNFVIDKNGEMNQSKSYGVKDMFFNKPYYVEEDIDCGLCRNTKGLRKTMKNVWKRLADMIEYNGLNVRVVNCNLKSNIDVFPKKELEL